MSPGDPVRRSCQQGNHGGGSLQSSPATPRPVAAGGPCQGERTPAALWVTAPAQPDLLPCSSSSRPDDPRGQGPWMATSPLGAAATQKNQGRAQISGIVSHQGERSSSHSLAGVGRMTCPAHCMPLISSLTSYSYMVGSFGPILPREKRGPREGSRLPRVSDSPQSIQRTTHHTKYTFPPSWAPASQLQPQIPKHAHEYSVFREAACQWL